MKKRTFLICSAMFLGIGLYMGYRSNQITSEEWEEFNLHSKSLIRKLNRRDYAACIDTFDDSMRESMTTDRMAQVFDPPLNTLGSFYKFKGITVQKKNPAISDYNTCQVRCEYQNGQATFTVFLDKDYKVGGVYLE